MARTDTHDTLCAERQALWTALAEAAPEFGIVPSTGWDKELPLALGGQVRLVVSLSQDKTSVYLVGRSDAARAWIADHLDALALGLRTVPGQASGEAAARRWFRKDNPRACVTVRRQWPEAIRWVRAQHMTFSRAVRSLDPA
ncbi:hypothetical protein DXV76_02200 [Rhodobacteraceae bacterium CCMM004]|nr:hypothetical protein DXV76_02200 [Rhodobacteraceae bacterium CCMM004]